MDTTVKQLGGNMYEVTTPDGRKHKVNLDGFTIMSDEDYNLLDKHDALTDDMLSPQFAESPIDQSAIEYAANYSGFVASDYLNNLNN